MARASVAPYGSWKSPITAELITAETIGFPEIDVDGDTIYWVEMRPAEGGRYVVVRRDPDGVVTELTPAEFNARTRVHEYGGGAVVASGGTVYFSNFNDQRLYRQEGDAAPEPLTPEGAQRFADAVVDAARGRLICVCEDHAGSGAEAVNSIVAVPLEGGVPRPLVSGRDFYAAPRLSPDGAWLAWLEWDHPNMPWDGTQLRLAALRPDGGIGAVVSVAGGPRESVMEPRWSPGGTLHFVSDRSGWWNLYRFHDGRTDPLAPIEAEIGEPPWVFGTSNYAFLSEQRIICAVGERGRWSLAMIDTAGGGLTRIDTPYSDIDLLQTTSREAVFLAGSPSHALSVVRLDAESLAIEELRASSEAAVDPAYLSRPETIEFPSAGGRTAHAFYYPPANPDYAGPADERPPLLVMSHGGPTAATSDTLNLRRQFWTSRGIGVLDVNYGGSSGYGRAYRRRLEGAWGIVDVEDCSAGARFLVARGDADPDRLAITGGSAGGWTTLCALTFDDTFRAGASHYGVSDAEGLATDTHKFESRYLDGLIGPYPERVELYHERSPIHHTDRLACPVIFFQGMEDKIVLPDQSQRMVEALRAKGIPVAYLEFEGEQHGFRRAPNIKRALEAELYFYGRIFGFAVADAIDPVAIDNL